MPQPMKTTVPHNLGKAEARRRLETGFATIERQLSGSLLGAVSFQNHWAGDQLSIEGRGLGQKIAGRLIVEENCVQIEIDLPEMLAALADQLRKKISMQTQLLLK